MTPNSEEIAAALEFCIEQTEQNGRRGGQPHWMKMAAVARAHLSRLREEARFMDAALVLWREFHGADDAGVKRDPYTKAAHAFVSAGVVRALEEPRDA